jgi:hypothetical protein
MKKIVLFVSVLSLGWASCKKENATRPLTKQEIRQKIDSILVEKDKELEEAGKVDLTLRYKIEVRAKTDSIINARKIKPVADTQVKIKQPLKANGFLGQPVKINTPNPTIQAPSPKQ